MLPALFDHRGRIIHGDDFTVALRALVGDYQAGFTKRATQVIDPAVRLYEQIGIQADHAQQ